MHEKHMNKESLNEKEKNLQNGVLNTHSLCTGNVPGVFVNYNMHIVGKH